MEFLYIVGGLLVGLLGGWFLWGRRASGTPADTSKPTSTVTAPTNVTTAKLAKPKPSRAEKPSTDDTPLAGTDEAAGPTTPAVEPVAVAEPVTEPVAEPVAEPVTEPVDPEPFAPVEPEVTPPPVAPSPRHAAESTFDDAEAKPAALEPVGEPVAAVADLPETTEPAITTPDAPAPVAVAVADDLTKIPGIGPKIKAALAGAGITTYRQLADTDVATLRAAISGAGLRLAPSLATWPERARQLADSQ